MLNLKCDQPYVSSLCFPNIFECWCQAVNYFSQFTRRMKTMILNVALSWTFQFFPIDKNKKTEIFQIRLCWINLAMLFTHLYLMQGEKQKPGLHHQQAENILVLNPQLFCLPTNSQKNYTLAGEMNC